MPSKFSFSKHRAGRHAGIRRETRRKPRSRLIRRLSLWELGAKTSLEDLARGLDACIEIWNKGKECKTTWKLRNWAMALIRFVSRSGGIKEQMSLVKSYFARCREMAINSEAIGWGDLPPVPMIRGLTVSRRREFLHQISRVSRSLRQATPEVIEKSLDEHFALAQCSFETPSHLRQRWKRFLLHRFSADAMASFTGVGTSSSFLRTKSTGGVSAEVKEITDAFRARVLGIHEIMELARRVPSFIRDMVTRVADVSVVETKIRAHKRARRSGIFPRFRVDDVFFLYDRNSELSLEDWEVAREKLFSLTASWFSIDFSELPRCRQVAVAERGYKVRVATPLEAPFRYLLSVINSALLSKLEEDPRVVSALHGCPAEKLDWSLGSRGHLVFSADLKSATDYFPQDLMLDAADVLSRGWPEELQQLFRRAVGPHLLFSPRKEKCCTTSRGILMGSPVSWPLLSMYSAWLHSESGSTGWFAVCGDDYIGCHTNTSYQRYLNVRRLTGAIGSPGKDILGKYSVGVFAEELVTVGRCRWIPTVSIRAVLGDPKSGLPAWQQGPMVSESLRRLSMPPTDELRICERLHSASIKQLRRVTIDPFAPRWAGGAGFPGVPDHGSLVLARKMMSQSEGLIIPWVTRLEGCWSSESSDPMLISAVAEDIERNCEFRRDTGVKGEWGPLRDVVASRLSSLSWPFYLAGAVKRQFRVGLASVSRVIRSVKDEVNQRGYWVPSGERITRGERLVDALQALEPQTKPIPFTPVPEPITLRGASAEHFLVKKRSTGPGSPDWGPRKRARIV